MPDKSPEIERVFEALNAITDEASGYVQMPAEGSPERLMLRVIEALVHLDGRLQALEARTA